jgi:beta-galactosidase
MDVLVDRLIQDKHLDHFTTPADVELTTRHYPDYALHFLINNGNQTETVDTSRFAGMLTLIGDGPVQATTELAPYGLIVIQETK